MSDQMYEWIDPWAAIEQVERFDRDWYDREDEHRSQMRGVQMSCADATYQIRRQAEAMMEPAIRAASLEMKPMFLSATEAERIRDIIRS